MSWKDYAVIHSAVGDFRLSDGKKRPRNLRLRTHNCADLRKKKSAELMFRKISHLRNCGCVSRKIHVKRDWIWTNHSDRRACVRQFYTAILAYNVRLRKHRSRLVAMQIVNRRQSGSSIDSVVPRWHNAVLQILTQLFPEVSNAPVMYPMITFR